MSIECPYCESDLADPDDCYDTGVNYQHECPDCGKVFVFEVEYVREYSAKKASCLNGAPHDYSPTNTVPRRWSRMRCSMCGDEQPLPLNHPYLNNEG